MKKIKYSILIIILILQFISVNAITLNDIDFNSDNIALGTFFSSKYGDNGSIVDDRIGLYVTTNGSDFVYIGETGVTGRDPRILYINGVFYLMATKGGSSAGGFAFNVFKSTDLVTWTNDTTYPFSHRYDVDIVENNKYGLPANNWGPKWYMEDGKLYIIITTTRFDKDGAKYYFIKGSDVTSDINPNNLTISDTNKGVLIKEYADLVDGKAQYVRNNKVYYTRDDKNNIYNLNGEKLTNDNGVYTDSTNNCILDTKNENKLSCEDKSSITLKIKTKREVVTYLKNNKKTIIQATCPWYDYPLFDMYISEVELGTSEEQKNIEYQNLKFKGFKKIKLKGYDFDDVSDKDRLYFLQHGTLFNLIEKNTSNTGYTYAMYLKTDPYGTVQRWVSNSLDGEWIQVDERFYPSDEVKKYNNDPKVCKSTSKLTSYEGKLYCTSNPCKTGVVEYGFNKHFEGAVITDFNGVRYFYSDHYNGNEYGNDPSPQEKTSISGIYYTTITSNNGKVDLTDVSHILFNVFHKVNVYNTDIRPTDIQDNVIRNGGVYRPNDMSKFKQILENASKFTLSYKIYSTNDDNKLIVVIKSNHAINGNKDQKWYKDGFRFITDIVNDNEVKILNNDLITSFKKYDSSVPYSSKEIYLYKVVDIDNIYDVTIKDLEGYAISLTISTKKEGVYDIEPTDEIVEEKKEINNELTIPNIIEDKRENNINDNIDNVDDIEDNNIEITDNEINDDEVINDEIINDNSNNIDGKLEKRKSPIVKDNNKFNYTLIIIIINILMLLIIGFIIGRKLHKKLERKM